MSYMKCPFCNQELDIDLKGECGCINEKCQKSVFMFGSEELWQELIRTKKKLDIAVDALKEIKYVGSWAYVGGLASEFTEPEIAQQALEQITALEQKDVK